MPEPSNFRPVFVAVAAVRGYGETDQHRAAMQAACRTDERSHPLLWRRLEAVVRRRYHRTTGEKLLASVDWTSVRDWLKEHWPQLISALCAVILLFLAL